MESRGKATKSISLCNGLSPTMTAHRTSRVGGWGETKVNGLKHACLVPCPKLSSEGTVAMAGVKTHCIEKKTDSSVLLLLCGGVSLLARKSGILTKFSHLPLPVIKHNTSFCPTFGTMFLFSIF